MKKSLVVLLMASAVVSYAQKDDASRFAKTISAKELKEKLTIVAGAEMEGRETATEGQRKAAAYIENQFKAIGLLPGNGNSYQMSYPVYQDELMSSALHIYSIPFTASQHYSITLNGVENGVINLSEVVFAGFGSTDSTNNELKDLDVKGKWVIVLDGTMENADKPAPTGNAGRFGAGNPQTKMQALRTRGAKGMILVAKDFPRTNPIATKGNMYMKRQGGTATPFFGTLSVSWQAAASILNRQVSNFAGFKNLKRGVYTTNVKLDVNKKTNTLSSTNVLGLLEGTDKKDEYVVITAHYDHLGKRDSVIYYGADDDGSGTVSVIELAEAFAAAKKKGKGPRRSILFMTVSGEEKGLWGSEVYANNPVFPLAKTTVNLNIDMVGRIDPTYKGDSTNYVFVIGEDKLSTDLIPITDEVNKKYMNMELDRRYNDIKDPNRYYYRSDHYNFAAKGVPIIFYFNGTHRDYHRPSDTVDKINFDLMQKRVKLVYYTAWEMANRDAMLKRDLKLDVPAR
jgi:hypothetical protein